MKPTTDLIDLNDNGEVEAQLVHPRHPCGRPAGARNTQRAELTRRLAVQALQEGRSPLHVMLENLSFFRSKAWELERELADAPANPNRVEAARLQRKFKALLLIRKLATDVAQAAAPYCHPRLNAISVETSDARPKIFVFTDDDAKL